MSNSIIGHTKGWGGQSAAKFGGSQVCRDYEWRMIVSSGDLGTEGERPKCENENPCSNRVRFRVEFEDGETVCLCPKHTPQSALSISPSLGERMLWASREGDLQSEVVVCVKNGQLCWIERHRVVENEVDSGCEWRPIYEVEFTFQDALRVTKIDYRGSVSSPEIERFYWGLDYDGAIPLLGGETAIDEVIEIAKQTAEKLGTGQPSK